MRRWIRCALLFLLPASPPAAGEEKELFLTAKVSDSSPFTGEEVELAYTLFFNGIAPRINDARKPLHQGIWAEDNAPGRLIPSRPGKVDGRTYRSAVIKRMKLVPLQSGELLVSGYRLRCAIPEDFAPGERTEPDRILTIDAPDVALDVRPLPEPKPDGFNGAVGSFEARTYADRDSLAKGETLRLTTVVSGRGSFRTLPGQPLFLPEGLRETGPESRGNIKKQPDGTGETLTKTFVLQAEAVGSYTFSPLAFTAFDPGSEVYTEVAARELTVTVLPPPAPAGPSRKNEENETSGQTAESVPPAPLPLFPVALSLALAALLLFLLIKKRKATGQTPAPRQASGNRRFPTSSLSSLRGDLYAAVEKRSGISPRGTALSELKRELLKCGTPEDIVEKLETLFGEMDRLEYSPGNYADSEIEPLRQSALSIIETLEKEAKTGA